MSKNLSYQDNERSQEGMSMEVLMLCFMTQLSHFKTNNPACCNGIENRFEQPGYKQHLEV